MSTELPQTPQDWIKDTPRNMDPKTGRRRPSSMAQVRLDSSKMLAKALKLRYVDGMTYPDISKVLGIPRETLRDWLKPFSVIMENPEEVRQFKAYEPHILDGIRLLLAKGMVEQLTDEKRRKTMDFSRLSWSYGTLYDKARLERGESTSNVMSLSDLVRAAHAQPVEAEVIEPGPKETA